MTFNFYLDENLVVSLSIFSMNELTDYICDEVFSLLLYIDLFFFGVDK